jgi:phosphosulfolactate synthase
VATDVEANCPVSPECDGGGTTMMIDSGLPTGLFTDVLESHGSLVDIVKFGWGTALVTKDIKRKIDICREHGVGAMCGGTLFERYVWGGRFDDYRRLMADLGVTHVEVSNGTIPLDSRTKARYVTAMATDYPVLAEVGFKDPTLSATLTPADWIDAVRRDLAAGATFVVTETRESGKSGIANPDGTIRSDVLRALLKAVDPTRLLFEAPTKDLQTELIRRVGPAVNVGNIAWADLVGLETLRLGLRSDTLLDIEPAAAPALAAA